MYLYMCDCASSARFGVNVSESLNISGSMNVSESMNDSGSMNVFGSMTETTLSRCSVGVEVPPESPQ